MTFPRCLGCILNPPILIMSPDECIERLNEASAVAHSYIYILDLEIIHFFIEIDFMYAQFGVSISV